MQRNLCRWMLQVASLALTSRVLVRPSFAFWSLPLVIPRDTRSKYLFHSNNNKQQRNPAFVNHCGYLLSSSGSSEVTEEDLLRWERMYESGSSPSKKKEEGLVIPGIRSEVRVVSFDLDNTLWKTSSTIDAANDALAAFLDSKNITQPIRVEKIMGKLFRENKAKYCPVEPDNAKAPVSLTLLRKDAIQKLLVDHNDYTPQEATDLAEAAFAEWARARHDAIPNHFASSVEACLQEIASLRTKKGHPILIGAITDGNSDPRNVEVLAEYFDFCVNAEMVGIAKPDKRVFLEAVLQVASHPCLSDLWSASGEDIGHDELEEILGPFWVHIGDDFVKDIVAAKNLNMRSIWARELVMDKFSTPILADDAQQKPSRTIEEFVKQVSNEEVVKMQVGADDYLADSLRQEFVDATVDRFSDLSRILKEWHSEGQGDEKTDEVLSALEFMTPMGDEELPLEAKAGNSRSVETKGSQKDQKFCLFCGATLPSVAKFCSSCGEKQEI